MTWVPPFFTCGECGGEIGRWPMLNLLRQEILDWRHRTVPEGVAPHRAVLGTPAHTPVIEPVVKKKADDVVLPNPAPPPIVPARLARPEEMPGPAVRLIKKATDHGWAWRAFYMAGPLMTASWQFNRWVQSVVVQLHRDGHRLVASWQAKYEKYADPEYSFDQAWSLTHFSEQISSPELTAVVTAPRMICADCGEPRAMHVTLDNGAPICHALWDAERRRSP